MVNKQDTTTIERQNYGVIEDETKNCKATYWIAKGSAVIAKESNTPDNYTVRGIIMPDGRKVSQKEVSIL